MMEKESGPHIESIRNYWFKRFSAEKSKKETLRQQIKEANKILVEIIELNKSYPLTMTRNKDSIDIQILERGSGAEDILPSLFERQDCLVHKLELLQKCLSQEQKEKQP